ncbi:ArsR/SmtB family transcription factor [Nonomuraea sp. NPDC059023]|uniref:ArsR/SmtB family transcription factor n=1 Tax=unclassified Nonomuraea TaxID=2593643 RepID=UPI0036A55ABB
MSVDAVFGALADPTRRTIMNVIASEGGASASALARHLPITRQGIAKHLAVLEEAGLITARRAGREVKYDARPELINEAMTWMAGIAAEWDDRLAALARLAQQEDPP